MSSSIALRGEDRVSGYRMLGWGASALVHGGVLAVLLYGPMMSEPPPAPDAVIPLEMASIPAAPAAPEEETGEVMEQTEVIAPEATSATNTPPPPMAMTAPEPVTTTEPPPPDTVAATPPIEAAPPPPDTVQAVEPDMQQPAEPDVVPLEAADIPPPPPAPPPPPMQARPPAPTSPRPAPRQEVARPAAPAATQHTQAPPGPVTAAPAQTAAPSVAPGRAAAPPADYATRVSGALNRAKRYPNRARLARVEGKVGVSFTILRDGTVAQWRIIQSSGNEDLDTAVAEMASRIRVPPLPAEYASDTMPISVAIDFNLR
jgi:protein TonB